MKKWIIIPVVLLFLLTAVYAVMQSNIGRNVVRSALTRALEDSGYTVQIDQVEGTLPHQINLKGISVKGEGFEATASEIRLRPVLWRLLKREAAFNDVQAKGVSVTGSAPFDFSGIFRINRKRLFVRGEVGEWSLYIRYHLKAQEAVFSVANDWLIARGNADFFPKLDANIRIRSNYLMAAAKIHQEGSAYLCAADWQMAELKNIGPIQGTASATYENGTLKGSVSAEGHANASFDLALFEKAGSAELHIDNLQALHVLGAYGKLEAKASGKLDELSIDASLNDFYYKDLYAETLNIHTDLRNLLMEGKKVKWKHLGVENGTFETTLTEGPYKLIASGTLPHPYTLQSDGSWKDRFIINIQTLSGQLLESPFSLIDPVEITASHEFFQVPEAIFAIGDGGASLKINREKDNTDASIHLTDFPLDFISFNPLEVKVAGTLNLDAEIKERANKLKGTFKSFVNQTAPLPSSGSFEGTFSKNLLKVKGGLAIRETPLLDLDATLPIHFSIWPFESEILFHKNAKGTLSFNGRVEEILDFFDLGAHRLEGNLQGAISFRNTLYRPLVEGKFAFTDGVYENYYSGTSLSNITANILAEKNSLFLQSITAQDSTGTGTLQGDGELHLLQSDLYPFRVRLNIDGLQFTEIDLVKATATGNLLLEGNMLSAIAKGEVQIQQCDLTIPDHIPRPLPHLDVVYRNAIHPVEPPQGHDHPYPLRLDLKISAPANISIEGRGLTSKWTGDFHLGGTATQLAAKGSLDLVEGEFNFSTRSFKLTEGSLAFSGIEHQMPYLNLAAQVETKGITITARLKGPLDDPQITLLSNPPLPLGSILSYLLFGQDISEIGGFQALQLATSLASLAGTGPDVMEATRKSLGVDRLRVVTEPTEEGGETVALQVGKYISKGVLVSFTQGADESSTNISVEIELKNNFVFQIESDQRQEQGKFTLKWNLNY
ncbi:MAG: translocation/assembly module TamB domain-containing protein [Parachlamydiales bacterium]|nr:translocation/assembly module TamB domain-containing protein [Parachlamydiales bacterium]